MIWALLAASAGCSLTYGGWAVLQSDSPLRTTLKTAATLLLVAAALLADGPWALVAALTASAVGDFFLARDGESQRLAGIAAFATAHGFLILLFVAKGADLSAALSVPGVILIVTAGVYATILSQNAGALARPVIGYVSIILTMALVALGLPAAYALGIWGAALFVFSDTLIGADFFLLGNRPALQRRIAPVIWFSYWGAQVLFVFAFALASAD